MYSLRFLHDIIDKKESDNMATTKEYKNFILEQLCLLDNITCKQMMREYLLYYNRVLFGGIYDDRLLVKIVENNKKYGMSKSIPYDGAKEMYLVDNVYLRKCQAKQ